MVNPAIGLQVEPALSALCFRARIPGDRQCLVAAAGKRDQILLQGVDTEGVADLVVGQVLQTAAPT